MDNETIKTLDELMAESAKKVTTGFLVYQTPEGQWVAEADLDSQLQVYRAATFDDIVTGSSAVVAGCTAQQAAMMTMNFMQQQAAAAQRAMQQQQEAQKVSQLIDPKKLRNPSA